MSSSSLSVKERGIYHQRANDLSLSYITLLRELALTKPELTAMLFRQDAGDIQRLLTIPFSLLMQQAKSGSLTLNMNYSEQIWRNIIYSLANDKPFYLATLIQQLPLIDHKLSPAINNPLSVVVTAEASA